MSHPAPSVYIDDVKMDAFKTDTMPVLAGMTIQFGVANDTEMQETETLALEILIREPSDTTFLDLGKIVAVVHEPTGTEDPITYFVGRIQRLHGQPDTAIKGALRISIQASDLTADLANETVYAVSNAPALAADRLSYMTVWAPDEWTLTTYPLRWPDRTHGNLFYKEKPFLELYDQFLRGQIMVRANRSTYTPGAGVHKELVSIQDSSQETKADLLGLYSDGRWGVVAGTPTAVSTAAVRIMASNIRADAGWTKEPEDVITEVSLQRLDTWPGGEDDVKRTPVTSRVHVDTAADRLAFGVRSLEFDTDLPAGGPAADLLPVFEHWLSTGSKWRASALTFRDTDALTLTQLAFLIAPRFRMTAFLVVRQPLENRPDRGTSDIRGFVIGGEATWTGKKWELTVTLGRVPGLPANGNYYTAENIATTANGYFAAGTCASVGDELSFSDFHRIGPPA